MAKWDEDAPSDDGIVAEDIVQLVEHIELAGENHMGSGPAWELATTSDESQPAPILTDDETRQIPKLQGMEFAEDVELFTGTELDLHRRLSQVEDEQLQLELAEALAAERAGWQQHVDGICSDLIERKRQFAEGAQEIENLSARLASITEQQPTSLADSAIASLYARLRERSRALLEAREEVERLRATREQLVAGIDVRDQFIEQMRVRLRALDNSVQGGGELRALMHHFFGGEQMAEGPAAVSPVLVAPTAAVPIVEAAPISADGLPPREVLVEDMQQSPPRMETPVMARSEPQVRHYLIGLDMVGSVYEMTLPRINVGRTKDNDLRIVDPTVSRLHAVLKLRGREVSVIDANSCNGVYVNGIQLRYAKLEDGDTLTFGAVRFRYRVGSGASGGDYGPD